MSNVNISQLPANTTPKLTDVIHDFPSGGADKSLLISVLTDYILAHGKPRTVLDFFDPTSALPVAPSNGDSYISAASANGWLINYIYVYHSNDASWQTIAPVTSLLVGIVATDSFYQWSGAAWTAFTIPSFESSTSNIKMDGAVSVGAASTVPRADHIHPSDTSRLAASRGNWKLFYSDGSGVFQELALSVANKYLMSNGVNAAPTLESITIPAGFSYWTAVPGSPAYASGTTIALTDTGGANSYKDLFVAGTILKWNKTVTFVDGDVTVASDIVTKVGHGFINGQKVRLTSTGTLPAGLSLYKDYYIVGVSGNNFSFSLTLGGAAVDITGAAGGGTHTITHRKVAFVISSALVTDTLTITVAGDTVVNGETGFYYNEIETVKEFRWAIQGNLYASTSVPIQPSWDVRKAIRILAVVPSVDVAPTGADILIDIHKDGTTIYTNQANRPTISATTLGGTVYSVIDVYEAGAGTKLAPFVDQIGSTIAGGASGYITVYYTEINTFYR